jgi:Na+/proline symporter
VLVAALGFVVAWGFWKGRKTQSLDGYLLADRQQRWYTIALSIMATQASAITFLSTPGQAYTDGMRFVQFYLGLPLAMVVLSITAVPIYHRLKVYTAYEYLEQRFGRGTRTVAATLFLLQRGVSTGITIYAPALIITVLLGWNIHATNIIIGALVIAYTAFGGSRAVSGTHVQQMAIIFIGMFAALFIAIHAMPAGVSFGEAVHVAGRMGRLNAIDFSFDLKNRYNFWSGIIGGFFLALSYFGTDQSQVQRYLTGSSVAQSRMGLLMNGLIKVPMQFFILFAGAMVFVFYQFVAPPLIFNPAERAHASSGSIARSFAALEQRHAQTFEAKRAGVLSLVTAMRSHDERAIGAATDHVRAIQKRDGEERAQAAVLLKQARPAADTNESNYVFLTFVITYLPAGLVGLVLAAILCASMSSTASGLSSVATTSVVDIYKNLIRRNESDVHYVRASKLMTVFWGVFAVGCAEFASRLGSLVEAVNLLGSLFYGPILGIFLVAFYCRRVGGHATVIAALAAEAVVLGCWAFSDMAYLWWNVVGCVVTVLLAVVIERIGLVVPGARMQNAERRMQN